MGNARRKYSIREDEFSVQYADEFDRKFWIRIEKPVTDVLIISDALQGKLSDDDMVAAFATVLAIHITDDVHRILFSDIAPEEVGVTPDTRRAADRFDVFLRWMLRWLDQSGRKLKNAHMDQKLGKFSAVFDLE